MLNEQLKLQIKQEAIERANGFANSRHAFIAKTEYALGAEMYATRAIAAEQENEILKDALNKIKNYSSGLQDASYRMKVIASDALLQIVKSNNE